MRNKLGQYTARPEEFSTIAECILRALPRGRESRAGDIVAIVRADYGSIAYRTILAHLASLSAKGTIKRTGRPKAYIYTRKGSK